MFKLFSDSSLDKYKCSSCFLTVPKGFVEGNINNRRKAGGKMENKNTTQENVINENEKIKTTAEDISEIYERQSRRYSKNLDAENEVK